MPFDPRIVEQDDDDAGLPPELSSLAGQLDRQADELARLYPARSARARADHRANPRWPWLRISAAALLIAGGTTLVATRWHGHGTPADNALSGGRGLARVTSDVDPSDASGAPAAAVPTVYFHELTGSEQEAVLDLLEDSGDDPSSLSI